jgi:hypothetical protein
MVAPVAAPAAAPPPVRSEGLVPQAARVAAIAAANAAMPTICLFMWFVLRHRAGFARGSGTCGGRCSCLPLRAQAMAAQGNFR